MTDIAGAARRWAADTTRWLRLPAERARARILAGDFRTSRGQFEALTDGAPAGDPRKRAWLVSSFPTVWGAKIEGALSLALRLRDFRPRPVYIAPDRWMVRYHSLFGLVGGIHLDAQAGRADRRPANAVAAAFLAGPRALGDLLAVRFRDVAIGRVALSNYLNAHKFERFDLSAPATAASIAAGLSTIAMNVQAAEHLLRQETPAVVLMLEKGVSPMAELFGVCVRDGIPVVQYAGAQKTDLYALKRYTRSNITDHPFSLDHKTWQDVKEMPWSPNDDAAIMNELEDAYRGGTWFNRKYLHEGKQIKPADAVRAQLGLDPGKKTVVVFSHVLWDATFFYGEGLFDDYETWLLETVRAACANPRLNWVIKIHPDLVWKLKYEGYEGELRDVIAVRSAVGELPPHVKLVLPDTDISTLSFFGITDYCLTVRGTIGIEMACHGVPVVTAGTGRYSGLGFTIDSASREGYLRRLATLETLPRAQPQQTELARRYAFAVFHCRPWELKSFQTVKAPIGQTGHPLDHNLVPRVRTFSELAAAADMREFAAWIDSPETDFIKLRTSEPACAAS